MGFEDMTVTLANPLEKLAATPLPEDLTKAATSICPLGAISTAMARGRTLASSQAGKPTAKMSDAQLGSLRKRAELRGRQGRARTGRLGAVEARLLCAP